MCFKFPNYWSGEVEEGWGRCQSLFSSAVCPPDLTFVMLWLVVCRSEQDCWRTASNISSPWNSTGRPFCSLATAGGETKTTRVVSCLRGSRDGCCKFWTPRDTPRSHKHASRLLFYCSSSSSSSSETSWNFDQQKDAGSRLAEFTWKGECEDQIRPPHIRESPKRPGWEGDWLQRLYRIIGGDGAQTSSDMAELCLQ